MNKRILGIAVGAIAGLSLSACGGNEGTPSSTSTSSTPSTQAVSAPADVRVANTSLGSVVTDASGRTLYMFTKDVNGTSTCYDQCAVAWPAVTVEDSDLVGDGVDKSLLGTTVRKDGSKQLTLKGMPLYRFASDTKAGDVNGQNNKNVWFVLRSDGSVVRDAAASGGQASTSSTSAPTTSTSTPASNKYSYGY